MICNSGKSQFQFISDSNQNCSIQFPFRPNNFPFNNMNKVLSRATSLGAPSYGGVRTWVEGSQTHWGRALAEASNLPTPTYTNTILIAIKLPTINAKYTPYLILIEN